METPHETRPNILILMPDELRADALSCSGHPVYRTPHIDRLAREGVRFTNAYATSPLCMPARASMISGLYPHNHHIYENSGHLPAGDETYAQLVQRAGYHTATIGKLHFFPDDAGRNFIELEDYVHARGFDHVHEIPGPGSLAKTESYLTRRWRELGVLERYREDLRRRREDRGAAAWASPLPEDEFADSYVGARAVEWLQAYERPAPFLLMVGFGGPHPPFDAPGHYATMYDPGAMPVPIPPAEPGPWLPEHARARLRRGHGSALQDWAEAVRIAQERMANYGGKLTLIDDWIGRILGVLDARGWTENTLVIFLSDHGEMGGDHGRYHKSVFYESAVRIPLILRWPGGQSRGLPAGRRVDALVEQFDLFATVVEAAGALPSERSFSRSWLPLARSDAAPVRDAAFSELGREVMIRTERYKYAADRHGRGYLLFDLLEDPQEQRNLVGHPDYAQVERDLRERMLVWLLTTQVSK